MKKFVKKLCAFLLIACMTIALFPARAEAGDGVCCSSCGEWTTDFCLDCKIGACCAYICDQCSMCDNCGITEEIHCMECDACFANDGVVFCYMCLRCDNCCDIYGEVDGMSACYDCMADYGEWCPECDDKIIRNPSGDDTENMGECGEHCIDCYEANCCTFCGQCALCEDLEFCEECEMCLECAIECETHCSICGICYQEANECWDGGNHCRECCEDYLCANCGACMLALDGELCDSCGFCENCVESEGMHCPLCENCYEDVAPCEFDGDHCEDCCYANDWLCGMCGECAEATGREICDQCGFCTECCQKNSKQLGLEDGTCVAEADPDKLLELHEESGKHILRYTFSATHHWQYCVVSGCDYETEAEPHTPSGKWTVTKNSGWGKGQEGEIACACSVCKYPTVTKKTTGIYVVFTKIPDNAVYGNDDTYYISYEVKRINPDGSTGKGFGYIYIYAKPKEGWPADPKDLYTDSKYEAYRVSGINPTYMKAQYGKADYRTSKTCYRMVYFNGGVGGNGVNPYYCYSNEFYVTWGKQHAHSMHLVSGLIGDYPYYKENNMFQGWNDRIHWYQCACGYTQNYEKCQPVCIATQATCQHLGAATYFCPLCEQEWTVPKDVGHHKSGGAVIYNADEHYELCMWCGEKMNEAKHSMKVISDDTTCFSHTVKRKCQYCGYTVIDKETFDTPKHEYNINAGIFYNDTHHWRFCLNCGYQDKHKHDWYNIDSDHLGCNFAGSIHTKSLTHGEVNVTFADCGHEGIELSINLSGKELSLWNNKNGVSDFIWSFGRGSDDRVPIAYGANARSITAAQLKAAIKKYEDTYGKKVKATEMDKYSFRYDITLVDDNGLTGVEYGHYTGGVNFHGVQWVDGYEATCLDDGMVEHYLCPTCGRMFDKSGKELSSVVIKAPGHHTYDNDCDQYCNVCGEHRDTQHVFGDTYSSDTNGHWNACINCGFTGIVTPHEYLPAEVIAHGSCTVDAELKLTCAVCAYSENVKVPAQGHQIEKVTREANCIMEGLSEHWGCTVCGQCYEDAKGTKVVPESKFYTGKDPNKHVGGPIEHDETNHWVHCACGADIKLEPHTFNEKGGCDYCGYNKLTHKPFDPSKKGGNLLKDFWWLWLLILLLLLAVIALIIILSAKKKKQKAEAAEAETISAGGDAPEPISEAPPTE